jgi:hypothetical protein
VKPVTSGCARVPKREWKWRDFCQRLCSLSSAGFSIRHAPDKIPATAADRDSMNLKIRKLRPKEPSSEQQ